MSFETGNGNGNGYSAPRPSAPSTQYGAPNANGNGNGGYPGSTAAAPSNQYGPPRNGNGNGYKSGSTSIQYDAPTNTIQAEARSEFVEPPSQSYGAPTAGIDTSVETTNSIYPDAPYSAERSSVPETIPQSYDANGGYNY